jgi:uncharacterized protein with HEPN domain
MSTRPWQQRVQDMLDAIGEIEQFCAGMTFDQFAADQKTLKAVSADFAILGEAAAYVPAEVTGARSDIPWSFMRAMRNRVVHGYFAVDPKVVWDTIRHELPPLRAQLEDLIQNPPSVTP